MCVSVSVSECVSVSEWEHVCEHVCAICVYMVSM